MRRAWPRLLPYEAALAHFRALAHARHQPVARHPWPRRGDGRAKKPFMGIGEYFERALLGGRTRAMCAAEAKATRELAAERAAEKRAKHLAAEDAKDVLGLGREDAGRLILGSRKLPAALDSDRIRARCSKLAQSGL